MKHDFKIEMGDFLEDFSVFYAELEDGKVKRELRADVAIVKDIFYYVPMFKRTIVLYVDSFKNWNSFKELSLYEYSVVLKRIYSFLRDTGYNIKLE